MSAYRNLVDWVNSHQEVVLDIIRIYLGIGLFVRGVLFITEPEGIGALVDLSNFSFASAALAAYVSFAHLLGGLMLAAGLLTRIAALIQIPILVGAVFLVHLQGGLLSANQSLEFATLVLFLLAVVFVFGGGRWSADRYVFVEESAPGADDLDMWWREEADAPTGDAAPGDGGEPEPVPVGGEGDIAVAGARTQATVEPTPAFGTLPRSAVEDNPTFDTCSCGNDVEHPHVTVEPRYGWSAGFFFMLGISAPVKEVVFYCEKCGTVMKRSRDTELLEKYRWHTS